MTSRETRRTFLDFFSTRGHRVVPSSPLVLPHDPTLLFANAGMNQFKDVFTGREERDYKRAVSSQKCLRVSGKHNDLEMVGRTPRHHTFFEMLGNFSFGDYFKHDAILFAWELVTKVYGVPRERLWATVFQGNDAVPADAEALAVWRDEVGLPTERVLALGEADNFWSMGDTGPCGPCTELHYDLGDDLTSVEGASTPATDSKRYVEIWNLVFMQFERQEGGAIEPLPAPSVDTGMGLERISTVLQGKRSNYETDLFMPLIEAAARRAGRRYGADAGDDFSLRVIADHARALAFLVGDGVVPSSDRRGYVLRRLLRRAIRHGRKLGITEPFLHEVTPVVIEGLGDVYPELVAARQAILDIGRNEEERFGETLAAGLGLLEQALDEAAKGPVPAVVRGADLFRLHDTFGFPLELARDIAEERGIGLDEAGFEAEMAAQRARAQASWKGGAKQEAPAAVTELAKRFETRFAGYDATHLEGVPILGLLDEAGKDVKALEQGQPGQAVLAATPFYAEAGGQVADTGWLTTEEGRAQVLDVKRPLGTLSLHRVEVESGRLAVGQAVSAAIDEERRLAVRRNHTATHLLHAALREVIGSHVKQAGSLVAPDRLRFDFSHYAGVTERALADIESLVNRKVLEDLPVLTDIVDLEQALESGAMALFGEKYGDRVRVVTIGSFSKELCGGTHCARSGEIGLIKLVQERGVAAGTRRVEAVSGEGALRRFQSAEATLQALEGQLSVTGEKLAAELERRLAELRALKREVESQRVGAVRERLLRLAAEPPVVAGVRLLAERVDGLGAQEMRELADGLRGKLGSGVVVLGRAEETKASVLVAVTRDLEARLPAGDLVRALARIIGGGGGGRPDIAEAGGKSPGRLDEALAALPAEIERRLETKTD